MTLSLCRSLIIITLIIIKKNRVFQNIIESSNIFLLLLFCYCKIVVKSFVTVRILYLEDCQTTTR